MMFSEEGPRKIGPSTRPDALTQTLPIRRLLINRTVIGVQISGFCSYWLLTLATLWLPAYLGEHFGIRLQSIAHVIVLLTICQLTLVPLIASLSQHMIRRGVRSSYARGIVAGLSVMAAGSITLLCPRLPGMLFPIVSLLAAFSVRAVIFVLGHVILALVTPPSQRGVVMGVTNAAITFAGPLTSVCMGLIADRHYGSIRGFDIGFTLVGSMVLAGGLLGTLLMNPARTPCLSGKPSAD